VFKQVYNYSLLDGDGVGFANLTFGLRSNFSFEWCMHECCYRRTVSQASMQLFVWHHIAVTVTEAAQVRVTYNGQLMGVVTSCAEATPSLNALSRTRLELTRLGPNISAETGDTWSESKRPQPNSKHRPAQQGHATRTSRKKGASAHNAGAMSKLVCSGRLLNDVLLSVRLHVCVCVCVCVCVFRREYYYASYRAEFAGLSFYDRQLLPEEVILASRSPPPNIASLAFPMRVITSPPLSMSPGQSILFSAYTPSFFGDPVTLWVAADAQGLFPLDNAWGQAGSELSPFHALGSGGSSVSRMVFVPKSLPSVDMAASVIRGVTIVWPADFAADRCVRFFTFLTGDTAHYAPPVLQNWTTCTSTAQRIFDARTAWYSGALRPKEAEWQNMSAPGYPTAGLIVFRTGVALHRLQWSSAADVAEGPRRVINVQDVGRDGLGFTEIFNVMQLRQRCDQILMVRTPRRHNSCAGVVVNSNGLSWSAGYDVRRTVCVCVCVYLLST
jgi:hypothetical protein